MACNCYKYTRSFSQAPGKLPVHFIVWQSKGTSYGAQKLKSSLHKRREFTNRSAEGKSPAKTAPKQLGTQAKQRLEWRARREQLIPSQPRWRHSCKRSAAASFPKASEQTARTWQNWSCLAGDLTDTPLSKAWPWAAVCAIRQRNITQMNGRQEMD